MEDADLTTENLKQFIDIAGSDWITAQIDKYKDFRSSHSPEGSWSHRPPSMSPVIPLVYWSSDEPYDPTYEPYMGYWWGEPKSILGRLAAQIRDFQEYLTNLPENRGLKNIRWLLRTPSRFASFDHEVRTASTYKMRTPYLVEPRFLDPSSEKGEPDIILRKEEQTFNVQCKSMDPSVSASMSYDLFNYLIGCLARINQDFDIHSCLTLNIEDDEVAINRRDVDIILAQIKESLINRSILIGLRPFSKGTFTFHKELSTKRQASHLSDKLTMWEHGHLFQERRSIPSRALSSYKLTTVCNISGGTYPSFEDFVYPRLEQSAKDAPKTNPLIICLHVYLPVDIHSYVKSTRIQKRVLPDLGNFFDRYRHVCLVLISSYAQQPFLVGENTQMVATPAWELESQYWNGERPDFYPPDFSALLEDTN